MNTTQYLTIRQRDVLGEIVDELLPAAYGMPSAREVDVHNQWIDEALRLRPDQRPGLIECIDSVDRQKGSLGIRGALTEFAAEHTESFGAAGNLIKGAYFMTDGARQAVGYPGQEARQLTDETNNYVEMLERVVNRGPMYRSPAD